MSSKKKAPGKMGADVSRRELEERRRRIRQLEQRAYELIGRAKLIEEMLARGTRAR